MPYTPAPRDPKAPPVRINLLSDTQTRPTPGMREAMARAEVGDEQIGDDPAVNLLSERVAESWRPYASAIIAAPNARTMIPAFSMVLYARRRLRSFWASAYSTPRIADSVPTAMNARPQFTSGIPRPRAQTLKRP